MKEHIEHQIIKKTALLFLLLCHTMNTFSFKKSDKKVYFPHEVVEKNVVEEKGLVRDGANINVFPRRKWQNVWE
jgi:hypothetical protein